MSGGTFSVSRGIWKHSAFKAEPFTEREAWMWLVSKASWKDRVDRAGDYVVPLKRGQLAAAVRYMAEKWRWTAPKVQRFIKRLQKLKMLMTEADTGVTVITICNYDDYQGGGQAADTGPIQDRYTTDTIKNNYGIQKEEGKEDMASGDAPSEPSPANDVSEAVRRWNDAAEKASWPTIQKMNPNRSKQLRGRLTDCGGLEGWEVALRKAWDSDFCRGRTANPWTGFSFDWLVKSSNFTKLMEGNYDNRTGTSDRPSDGPQDRSDPALENIARLARDRAARSHGGG